VECHAASVLNLWAKGLEDFPMAVGGYWVHNLDPFLWKFPDGWPLAGIHWYGVAYVLAFALVADLLKFYGKMGRLPFPSVQTSNYVFTIAIGVVVGGRVGYMILYDLSTLVRDPLEIFRIWHGGMASHGGFVGVMVALYAFSRIHRIPVLPLGDTIASLAPLGFFLGRMANFINGEIYGRVTTVPWAILFPKSAAQGPLPPEFLFPRHPSQLYEAIVEGLLLFAFCQWRFWTNGPSRRPGRLTGEFFILYALGRMGCEWFREPDAPLICGCTAGQFYSLFLGALGMYLWIRTSPGKR
jgi:phosphatidylglycerol:prolipoprotein diacylglycerol transferase